MLKNMTATSQSRMLCPQSVALQFVTFKKWNIHTMFNRHPTSSYIPQKHAEIWMIMIHVRITCSPVLAGSSNSRRSTVQTHVQYSPSMSKLSECKLKGHQLLHGSSNTLPISPANTANISLKHIKEIYKRTTTWPQTTWQCDSLPW